MRFVFMYHVYKTVLLLENIYFSTMDEYRNWFIEQYPFLLHWKELMEWTMVEDEIQCRMKVNQRTLCIRNTIEDTITYLPFFLGMRIDELKKIILLLYPDQRMMITIYYMDSWYIPVNEYVVVPFYSTECEIESNVYPIRVRII